MVGRLAQLGLVDIDVDHMRRARERRPVVARLPNVQTRAEDDQEVRVLHDEVARARADRAGPPAEQGMVRRDQIVGPRGDDRNPQAFGQCDEVIERAREPHARASHQHRTLCKRELFDDARAARVEFGGGDDRMRARVCVLPGHIALERLGFDLRRLHVDRNVEPHRPRSSRRREMPRLVELMRDAQRVGHDRRVFGDRRRHPHDVHFLIAELTKAGNRRRGQTGLALDLSGQHDHRNRIGPRAEHAVQRVDAAGSGGDDAHAGPCGESRIAFGRHRTGLLVMLIDRGDARMKAERVVEKHRSAPGQREDVRHACVGDTIG